MGNKTLYPQKKSLLKYLASALFSYIYLALISAYMFYFNPNINLHPLKNGSNFFSLVKKANSIIIND